MASQPDSQPDQSASTAGDSTEPSRFQDASILPFPKVTGATPSGQTTTGETDLRKVFGDVLRDERHHQERTLAEVAAASAVSLAYLSEIERGRKDVSSELLNAVCDALELPLSDMLERSADRLRAQRNIQFMACAA